MLSLLLGLVAERLLHWRRLAQRSFREKRAEVDRVILLQDLRRFRSRVLVDSIMRSSTQTSDPMRASSLVDRLWDLSGCCRIYPIQSLRGLKSRQRTHISEVRVKVDSDRHGHIESEVIPHERLWLGRGRPARKADILLLLLVAVNLNHTIVCLLKHKHSVCGFGRNA